MYQESPLTASSALAPNDAATTGGGKRIYRPELDALRFFAFLAVFFHHAINVSPNSLLMRHPFFRQWLPVTKEACGFGLSPFFFLSSYLITALLTIEKKKTGTVDLRKFYIRRILRIWPLYFFFLGVAFCLGLILTKYRIEPVRLLALALLAGNWYSVLHGTGTLSIFQLWSISIEEQFYLVWPSLARVTTRKTLIWLCGLICVMSTVVAGLLVESGSTAIAVWCNSFVESIFFASGALMALWIGIAERTKSIRNAAISILAGIVVFIGAERLGGLTNHNGQPHAVAFAIGYPLVALGCGLVLWGFLCIPSAFLPAPLVYLGRISYGLYVFHGLAMIWVESSMARFLPPGGVSLMAEVVLASILAALSYQFLEKPFLRLKSRFELVHTRA